MTRAIVERGGLFTVTAEIELQMGYGHPLAGALLALGSRKPVPMHPVTHAWEQLGANNTASKFA